MITKWLIFKIKRETMGSRENGGGNNKEQSLNREIMFFSEILYSMMDTVKVYLKIAKSKFQIFTRKYLS